MYHTSIFTQKSIFTQIYVHTRMYCNKMRLKRKYEYQTILKALIGLRIMQVVMAWFVNNGKKLNGKKERGGRSKMNDEKGLIKKTGLQA